ncbi:YbfB/YjiJ family MFS transporter [Enterovirga sp. CN4-39]|uniref:YbfB/YjiJ family MFS transporter n=1 Tax=Enterovirga sp. CN4-39 TaxID=3400910 RepID=UPI003C0F005A
MADSAEGQPAAGIVEPRAGVRILGSGFQPSLGGARPTMLAEARLPRRLIAWAFLAMALDIGVARISFGTVLPALRRDLDLTFFAGGALSAANLAAYLAGTLLAPYFGRYASMSALARWGHVVFAFGALANGLASDIPTLAVGRVLTGLGAGVGLLALFVVVFERTRPDLRPVVSTAVWAGIGTAIIASGLSAPFLLHEPGDWRWAFCLPALLALLVAWEVGRGHRIGTTAGRPRQGHTDSTSPASRPWPSWLGLFGAYFMFGVGYIAYSTFVGGRLAQANAPMATVVASWVTLGLGSIAGSILGAAILWSRAWKPFALILASLAGAAGSAAAIAPGGVAPLAGALLVGLGLASTPAIVTAYVRERTSDAAYARLFSLATASLGVGQLVGPVIAGALADGVGPDAVMVFASAAYAIGAVCAVADMLTVRTNPA